MKLQFLGAVRQVTGSKYYVETDGTRILVDCGMYQERDFLDRNWNALPVRPRDIDVVLLTHAHIDHCGLLPKLVADGFHGKILATAPTCDLVDILLRDSAQIQAEDAEFKQKRHRKEGREGRYPVKPLYTLRDVRADAAPAGTGLVPRARAAGRKRLGRVSRGGPYPRRGDGRTDRPGARRFAAAGLQRRPGHAGQAVRPQPGSAHRGRLARASNRPTATAITPTAAASKISLPRRSTKRSMPAAR